MTSHHIAVTDDVEQEEVTNYRNHYACTSCLHMWESVWTATCDDKCPVCKLSSSPVKSEELESEDVTPEQVNAQRIVEDFSQAVRLFGVDRDTDPYAMKAVEIYGEEGRIEIDEKVVVSTSEKGRYVMAWVFVSDEAVEDATEAFRNHYVCPKCSHQWTDLWLVIDNDECDQCGTSSSPVKSDKYLTWGKVSAKAVESTPSGE